MVGVTVHPPSRLFGRAGELEILGQLVADARSGRSAVLVVRGEPGIGKTALLRHLVGEAPGFRVIRGAGVESEMELPFAGLHQLCAPMLGRLDRLAEPQRHGLSVAFGLAPGAKPDRFLVALAALSLLAEASEEQPLLCVVDDAQWLDQASALVLGFVGRRLLAEPVALVFAARRPAASPDHLAGLPEFRLGGLDESRLARCWRRSPRARSTRACGAGSSRRHAATRSPCSSCAAGWAQPSWPAGSRCRTRGICRRASRISTSSALGSCRRRPGSWSCWPRPIRSATRR